MISVEVLRYLEVWFGMQQDYTGETPEAALHRRIDGAHELRALDQGDPHTRHRAMELYLSGDWTPPAPPPPPIEYLREQRRERRERALAQWDLGLMTTADLRAVLVEEPAV